MTHIKIPPGASLTGYHYSDDDFSEGFVLGRRARDGLEHLAFSRRPAERAIRAGRQDGDFVRSTAVYACRDLPWAEEMLAEEKKRFLYQVSIEAAHILHVGDLGHHKDAELALEEFLWPDIPVARYWNRFSHFPHHEMPRVEILAREATVMRKLKSAR